MPTVNYKAHGFSPQFGPQLRGRHQYHFSWADLVRCSVKVGRPSWYHVLRHGIASLHEVLYRRHLVFANLSENWRGEIERSGAYRWLDPSEKGAVSYFIGMSVAALLSETLLAVPWLIHISVYRHLLPPIVISPSKRPDLVGFNRQSQAVVIEAKGRTNAPESQLLQKAKAQASYVRSVGGSPPLAHVASIAHFRGGTLGAEWEDPQPNSELSFDLPIQADEAIDDYYLPMRALLTAPDVPVVGREYEGRQYTVAQLPATSDFFGLETDLLKTTRKPGASGDSLMPPPPDIDTRISVGPDGTYVELGPEWRRDQMTKEPDERSA